ncbi:MAG TPA: lipid A biosynthesis acyltransferase [Campylobacterales bacterium]|nr:lipid A biosynthesis acyltransferase [Campylobacterales bacterium]
MIDYFYLFLYKIFTLLSKLLPRPLMNRLLRGLSWVAYKMDKKHQHIINANLRLAFGEEMGQQERDSIGKRTFYNLLQTIVGFMRRNGKSKEELLQNITFKNEHILQNAIDANKKIIFVTGHYSNWELLPPAITSKFGITLVGIGRKLDSKLMDRVLINNREQFGVEMLYRRGGMKGALKSLKEGKAVGLLLDQHLGAKQGGIEVEFFKHRTMQSPAASVMARSFEADMIPAYISTDDYSNYVVTFYEPIPCVKTDDKDADLLAMTQAQAKVMEEVIEAKPEEWFWVHKRWKGLYPEIYQRDQS